jgi:hypothetical protein
MAGWVAHQMYGAGSLEDDDEEDRSLSICLIERANQRWNWSFGIWNWASACAISVQHTGIAF